MLRFSDNLIAQMTRKCNLKCRYCYEVNGGEWKDKAMSVETFKQVLDTYLYYRCILGRFENRAQWHFHGGEVLMLPWEDLKRMIEHIEKRQNLFPNLSWCLQTNALNITDEIAKFFAKRNQTIGISFDGFHSIDRMSSAQAERLIGRLRQYHTEYGTMFSVLSVLTSKNIEYWYEDMLIVADFASGFGVNIICTREEDDALIPSPEKQWQYWLFPVLESWRKGNVAIDERGVRYAVMKLVQQLVFDTDIMETDKTGCFDRICGFESNMTAIDPNLDMHSCDKFLERGDYIGLREKHHITERDFLGLRQANRTVQHYRKMFTLEKERGCDMCPSRWICPGECQAYNISKYGERRLSDSMCSVYRRAYDYVDEHLEDILLHNSICISGKVSGILPQAAKRLNNTGISIHYDPASGILTAEQKEKRNGN